ncbi:DedA family protein [Bacillus sp. BRMEA1]|uniref:DedA family protein n=1 Tax=Neobacillus endophyticus TaxID=2738405 RepID=UPI00156640C0|nr:DedA family protein [Neobacillus endophyticus]NRD78168.1 DedA family protein [Neobacillus endophyticus]
MSILHQLGEIAINWINSIGYWGILLGMILESACIPIPSEVIMPFGGFLVSTGHLNLIGVILVGTLGNLIGSLIAYAIGHWGGKRFIDRFGKYVFLSQKHLEAAENWFDKRGEIAVFVSRILPAIRTFISLPAGIARMSLAKFLTYTAIGSVIWSSILTYVGYVLGKNWGNIQGFLHPIAYLVAGIVAVILIYLVLKVVKGKKASA